MKRGVLIVLAAILAVTLAHAFDVTIDPDTITADVQAGGYVAEVINIHTDRAVEVFARAPKALAGIMRLTRINATSIAVHVLPPIDAGEMSLTGQIELDVQGQDPFVSAGVQRISVPLNVTVNVRGRAPAPAIVDLDSAKEIEIVPLSGEGATLIAIIVAGIVAVNIVLRTRLRKRK